MAGIHVEGPFINGGSGYVGAHPAAHVIPASPAAIFEQVENFFFINFPF
jgi:N-acetylglucosamine-6-phosphate deacetylase